MSGTRTKIFLLLLLNLSWYLGPGFRYRRGFDLLGRVKLYESGDQDNQIIRANLVNVLQLEFVGVDVVIVWLAL